MLWKGLIREHGGNYVRDAIYVIRWWQWFRYVQLNFDLNFLSFSLAEYLQLCFTIIVGLSLTTTAATARGAHKSTAAILTASRVVILGHFILTKSTRTSVYRAASTAFQFIIRYTCWHWGGDITRFIDAHHPTIQRRATVSSHESAYANESAERWWTRLGFDFRDVIDGRAWLIESTLEFGSDTFSYVTATNDERITSTDSRLATRYEFYFAELSGDLSNKV